MTDVLTPMFRRALISFLLLIQSPIWAASPMREAPNLAASPANQLDLSASACGPTALINAFRFGSTEWQQASSSIKGDTDVKRIKYIIQKASTTPSKSISGKSRWSRRGLNITDLKDMANDLAKGHGLPPIEETILFLKSGETLEQLLRRCHGLGNTSLANGLPPILSLRRYALRTEKGAKPTWTVIAAHFVTLCRIPRDLKKNARSFEISYIDPWGGKIHPGSIGIPTRPVLADSTAKSPCLEAIFPEAWVGKNHIRPGETTVVTLAASIGEW